VTKSFARHSGARTCLFASIFVALHAAPLEAAVDRGALMRNASMLDARVNYPQGFQAAAAGRSTEITNALAAARSRNDAIGSAARSLQQIDPGLQLRVSPITGAPDSVGSKGGPLTGPDARGSEAIVRDYLRRRGALYGLSTADVGDLVALGDSPGGKSGLRMLRMEQQIDGRPVFQSETRFVLDRRGSLIKSNGQLVPAARSSVAAFDAGSLISAPAAVAALLGSAGENGSASEFAIASTTQGRLRLTESNDYVAGDITAREVLFPLAPGLLVPAWSLVVFTGGEHDWYAVVDARSGALLWRKDIRSHASTQEARFSVYVQADGVTPADNPAPASPTTAVAGAGTQFPEIARSIVNMSTAQDVTASPNGWIDDGNTTTTGNNVDACADAVGGAGETNVCDIGTVDNNGRPVGNPDVNANNRDFLGAAPRDFNYTPSPVGGNPNAGDTPTGVAQVAFRRGATTQMFYASNWYHDQLFALGFDEASANFQQTNFSGMGVGGDRVLADVQDASGTNNANFATPPDGTSGRAQMFRFTGPAPDRDGDLDTEIVIHELTHGLSNRLIGNAAGLEWSPGQGMGEGWSDFYALSLLNNTNADLPDAAYASGSYATYQLGGLTDNYLYGIRRFPYSTDNNVNPMTWADVDDTTTDYSGGVPISPLGFEFNGGLEVHNLGEIWMLSLWEVRSRVIADPAGANGDVPTGNQTMLQLVTDALKLTPTNPSVAEARDALIEADCAANACANERWIWEGFADRGLGFGAVAPLGVMGAFNFGNMGVGESFALPSLEVASVTIDDSDGNNNGAIDPGEPVRLSVSLRNPWNHASGAENNVTATLVALSPSVTLYDDELTFGAIAQQSVVAAGDDLLFTLDPAAACGSSLKFQLDISTDAGVSSTDFEVRIGTANGVGPVVTYTNASALAIPDGDSRGVFNVLNIAEDLLIADLDYRLDNLAHTFTGDLTVMLRGPDGLGGNLIWLREALLGGGDGDNFINTVIDDDAAGDLNSSPAAAAPYTGSWLPAFNSPFWPNLVGVPSDPIGLMSRYNGKSTAGDWTTFVADQFNLDSGTLNSWSLLVTPVNFDCTAFDAAPAVSGTKAVAGDFREGGTVTYTIVLTNDGTDNQPDNATDEFVDQLPTGLTLVSSNASSGFTADAGGNKVVWNGSLAPLGGSTTITIVATVDAGTMDTTLTNQAEIWFDADGDGVNESLRPTDDPSLPGVNEPTSFDVQFAELSASKTVAGSYIVGQPVTYTIVISNTGTGDSVDNPGHDLYDALPAGFTVDNVSATSGTAAIQGTDVTWNGSVPAQGSVTVTIAGTVSPAATGTVVNQGVVSFDPALGNNQTSVLTDDPGLPGAQDPTAFSLVGTDLSISKSNGQTGMVIGSTVTYTIQAANAGPLAVVDATLVDTLPLALTGASWTCSASGTVCPSGAGSGNINELVDLPVGATITYLVTATVAFSVGDVITNTATITAPPSPPESDPANNTASDADLVLSTILFADGFED
jgi:uncharacterized repeat protein (TIGR01451 family)